MHHALLALWRFRHFVGSSIHAEWKFRYARSRLGASWAVLHPLTQSAIYAIVLAEVLGARLPNAAGKADYPIYLLAGVAAWTLFSEVLSRSLTVFIDYSAALKKVAFPRLCLPVIVWGGALINHTLLLLALALVSGFLGHFAGWGWLHLPLGIVLISALAFGIGVLAGIFNTFCRDVGQVFTVLLQLWFWLTPIVYPIEAVPANLRWLMHVNPMTPLVAIYQDALLRQTGPAIAPLLPGIALAATLCGMGFLLFRRASSELVDAL